LRTFVINLYGMDTQTENVLVIDIVKTFLKSLSLKKLTVVRMNDYAITNLELGPIPMIESICRTHRFRPVCITVFGVSYLR